LIIEIKLKKTRERNEVQTAGPRKGEAPVA
jgi:hypothetical protein